MLITLSAEQIPRFTQTAIGGKMMAIKPRKMSLPHMLIAFLVYLEVLLGGCLLGFPLREARYATKVGAYVKYPQRR